MNDYKIFNIPVYIFNTEKTEELDIHFDEYYLLASGFKELFVVKNYSATLIYYDINKNALKFKEDLFNQWNFTKKDLWNFINDLDYLWTLSGYNNTNFYNQTLKEQFDINWTSFVASISLETFLKIQQMEKKYIEFDIIKNDIEELIVKDSYLWYSNVFEFDHGSYTIDEQKKSYSIFRKKLKKLNIYGDGLDPIKQSTIVGYYV